MAEKDDQIDNGRATILWVRGIVRSLTGGLTHTIFVNFIL